MQCGSLQAKIEIAQNNIVEWYEYWDGKVAVSFSGGKDSTALLHLVRRLYPEVKAVFFNTGLEYPECVSLVKRTPNVEWLRPKMPFHRVVREYGYPVVSKVVSQKIWEIRHAKSRFSYNRKLSGLIGLSLPKKYRYLIAAPFPISDKCCNVLKKRPSRDFQKRTGLMPMIGVMASDGRSRLLSHLRHGCNAFKKVRPESRPIMSWTEDDVWAYIRLHGLDYASIYDNGAQNTGCMFCGFGVHYDGRPNRYELMREQHPKQYDFVMNNLEFGPVLEFMGTPL